MIHITSKILIIFPNLIIIWYLYIININIIYINRLFCSMDFKYFSNIFSKFYLIFMCNFWSLLRITKLILIFYNNLNQILSLFFFFFFFFFLYKLFSFYSLSFFFFLPFFCRKKLITISSIFTFLFLIFFIILFFHFLFL